MTIDVQRPARILFITGTDTGVGKTLLTGLLLRHLRDGGRHALAMKPFCSGGRADVKFLGALQDGELTADEINPFYFSEPVAPLISLRSRRGEIDLRDVLRRIKKIAARCEWLLIEGAGGLFVPLGQKFLVSDLIRRLNCEVIVASRNHLGTINHTLLTVRALRRLGVRRVKVALMTGAKTDMSSATNGKILRELLAPVEICTINFLGGNVRKSGSLKKSSKKIKKTLARFCR